MLVELLTLVLSERRVDAVAAMRGYAYSCLSALKQITSGAVLLEACRDPLIG